MLPLTPLQQGLLFHASTTQANDDDVYAVQLEFTITGPLEPQRLRAAVDTVIKRHPTWCPILRPVRRARADHPADPVAPWRYVELDGDGIDEQIQHVCAAERVAVYNLTGQPAFRPR
ncbi:condensation domain protein [Mycobacterium xenopi 4042]|uniref:Condensation domain protein n=1 Tax=Mycobacterium xenopi 4042 TaxID=1299334 RepID=X7YXF2_MYCXE|nr:condensation domain protein [Mycobacterium xenopi 4042]